MPAEKPQEARPNVDSPNTERTPDTSPPTDSPHRYRLLFEHNLAGVYCTAIDGQILDCNESMARMLGYESREELLACSARELYFTPGDRQAFQSFLRQHLP